MELLGCTTSNVIFYEIFSMKENFFMPCHIEFERTTHPLSNDIFNYMSALKFIRFLIHLKCLSISYIYSLLHALRVSLEKKCYTSYRFNFLVYGHNALDVHICHRLFARLRSGDFCFYDIEGQSKIKSPQF